MNGMRKTSLTPNPTRFYSRQQENEVSKKIGGRRTANSGATPFSKGDVSCGNSFLIECKTCIEPKKSQAIKEEWLQKIQEECLAMGKRGWALFFNFGGKGAQNYVIISEKQFIEYKKLLEDS